MTVGGTAPVYLSAISHSVGTKVALADLDDPVLHSRLDTLHDQGLRYCRITTEQPVMLAAASALDSLRQAGEPDVGAVVYCTDTRTDVGQTGDLWDFLLRIDRPTSRGIVLGGSGCDNLGPGLAAASATVRAEGTTVLLVTTDRVAGGTRYLPNGETVLSDGSACCLVGARPIGPSFVVRGLASSVQADVESSPTRMSMARRTAHAIAATARRAIDPRSPADFGLLVTGNYGHTPRALLAMAAGIAPEYVHCPTLAEVGHCFSADVLIGLATLLEDRPEFREPVMLLTASPRSWSVAFVERVDGE